MDKLRRFHQSLIGDEEEQEEDLLGEFNASCSLSPLQRLYGFAACLVAGLAFMILSLIVFYRPIKFAVMFSFGNILAIGSTVFLIGPVQQTRMMLDPVRFYATAIYVGSVVLALICALWIHIKFLTLIAIISEICALICHWNGAIGMNEQRNFSFAFPILPSSMAASMAKDAIAIDIAQGKSSHKAARS